VLLLDEPLTALDAALRERLRGELDRLLRTLGITTIYVTHDQSEAMALGDRIVVMSKGAIAQVGQPRDIYFTPARRFVAEFIGAANIVEGKSAGGRLILPGGWLTLAEGAPTGHVSAMLRPESIRVVDVAGAGLTGRVDSVSFVGDRQRLTINDAAKGAIFVDVPNTLAVKFGDQVGLAADPSAIRVLPDGN
jgi:putative spermidine/putrescine transport system ATP-binding protein